MNVSCEFFQLSRAISDPFRTKQDFLYSFWVEAGQKSPIGQAGMFAGDNETLKSGNTKLPSLAIFANYSQELGKIDYRFCNERLKTRCNAAFAICGIGKRRYCDGRKITQARHRTNALQALHSINF